MPGKARRPSLACLRTLLLYAEKKEAKAVARELHKTPAVVSRCLTELRTRYGLLQKQGNLQTLTRRGQEAVPVIRALLRQHDHLVEWLAGRQVGPRVILVATGSLTSQLYLPRALALFTEEHPDWQVQVQVRRGRDRILGTAGGAFDLALVSHDPAQIQTVLAAGHGEQRGLAVEELTRERMCVVARKDTGAGERLARALEGQAVPLSRLGDFELIGLDAQSGIRRQLEDHANGSGRPLQFRVEAGGWAAARECAREGLGVAVVPLALLARDDRKDLVIRLLATDVGVREFLIYRHDTLNAGPAALRLALRRAVEARQQELRDRWHGILSL
jgi:DNA-binding transcriptional LysR family regulator